VYKSPKCSLSKPSVGGSLNYAVTALQAIWQADLLEQRFVSTGNRYSENDSNCGRQWSLLRGGMTVVHDATIDDQRLNLYSLELQHWWQIIAMPALRRGRHTTWQGVRSLQERGLYPQTSSINGEITTYTPAKFVIPYLWLFWFLDDLISK